MDTITDMLSTFFVARNRRRRHSDGKSNQQTQTTPPVVDNENPSTPEPTVEQRVKERSKDSENTNTTSETTEPQSESSMTFSETDSSNSQHEQNSKEPEPSQNLLLKKYILRAIDMYKKNIMIVNNDQSENMAMLSDLLHTFSLMNRVDEIYKNTIYVVSSAETRNFYKTMLFENPYLYFTDFKIKQGLSKLKIKELQNSDDKRTIVIVQQSDDKDLDEYLELLKGNVQLIVLGKISKPMLDLYKQLGDNKLLMHKKEKLKSLQKLFFDKVVRLICQTQCDFHDYFQQVNADTFGIRYIVIKNDELRYY